MQFLQLGQGETLVMVYDLKARTEDNRIPTEWAVEANYVPTVTPAELPHMVYTEQQRRKEEAMQKDAYGYSTPVRDFGNVRFMAAEEIKQNREDLVIAAAEKASDLGVHPEVIKEFLGVEVSDRLKDVSLEIQSIENPTIEALNENEDLRAFYEDASNDALGSFSHYMTQGQIIEKFLNKAEDVRSDEEAVRWGTYLLAQTIPFYEWTKIKTVDPLDVGFKFLSAGTRQEQMNIVWDAAKKMSPEDFYSYCTGLDNALREATKDPYAVKSFWEGMLQGPTIGEDFDALLDATTIGGYGLIKRFASRGAKSISAINKVGDKKKIAQDTKDLLTAKKTGAVLEAASEEKLISNLTDTAIHPTPDVQNAMGGRNATKDVAHSEALEDVTLKTYNSFIKPTALTEEDAVRQLDAWKRYTEDRIVHKAGKKDVLDNVKISAERNEKGELVGIVDLGTGSNGSYTFVDEASAQAAAKKYLPFLKGEYTVFPDANGWKVRAKMSVPDQGYIVRDWEKNKEFKGSGATTFATGRIWIPGEYHAQDTALIAGKGARQNLLDSEYLKIARKLSKEEEAGLDAIYAQGISEEARYSDEVLRDRFNATDRQIEAYRAGYKLSDLNAASINGAVRHKFVQQGYRDISAGGEHWLGKHIDGIKQEDYLRSTFKDASNGKVYDVGDMSEEMWRTLEKNNDYVMVRLKAPELEYIDDDTTVPVQFIIAPRDMMKSSELPNWIIGWHDEGHRFYDENMLFAKQPVTFNKGTYTSLMERTLFADLDGKAVRQQVKEINSVLPIYRKYKAGDLTKTQASIEMNKATATNDYFRAGDVDDFEGFLRTKDNPNGVIADWKHDIEVVHSGEELHQSAVLRAQGAVPLYESSKDTIDELFDLTNSAGNGYWKRGKNPLKTFQGDPVPTVNFRSMVQKNINNTIYLDTNRPYTEWYGRRFKELFGDIVKPGYLESLSDDELLRSADVLKEPAKGVSRAKYNAARNMQKDYLLRASPKTQYDKQVEAYMNYVAESVADSKWAKEFNIAQRGSAGFDFIKNFEPQNFLKSVNYICNFGWWNIRQAWMQAAGTLNAVLISPAASAKVLSRYNAILGGVLAKDAGQIDEAVKAMKFAGLFEEKEARGLIDYLRRIGVNTSSERLSQYQSLNGFKGIMDTNTAFFRMGERLNAVTAQGASYLEYIKKHPEKIGKALSNEEVVEVFGRGDDIYLNMSKASNSPLQESALTRLPAQYTAFGIRNIEAILGRQLKPDEKFRLFFGNLALYGTAGTLGYSGYNLYKWADEQGIDNETAEIFRTGLANHFARELGWDDAALHEMGPQALGEGLVGRMGDLIQDGELDLLQATPATSAVRILKDTPASIGDTYKIIKDIVLPDATEDDIISHVFSLSTRNTPTAVSKYTQAWLGWKLGVITNKRGQIIKDNVTWQDALRHAFGFSSSSQESTSLLYEVIRDKDKLLKDMVKDLEPLWANYRRTGSDAMLQDYTNLYATFRSTLDGNDQRRLSQMVNSMQRQHGLSTVLDKKIASSRKQLSNKELQLIQNIPSIKGARQ